MECKTEISEGNFVVTLRGGKRKRVVLHLLATGVFLATVHLLIYRSKVRFIAELGSALWALFIVLRQQYGTSVLTIAGDFVSLNRHVLGPVEPGASLVRTLNDWDMNRKLVKTTPHLR
jgi:hypothetical protein